MGSPRNAGVENHMKLEFFVEGIAYSSFTQKPMVAIILRNKIKEDDTGPVIVTDKRDIAKAVFKMMHDNNGLQRIELMIDFAEYEKSGMKIGDRLEIDVSVKNMDGPTI